MNVKLQYFCKCVELHQYEVNARIAQLKEHWDLGGHASS